MEMANKYTLTKVVKLIATMPLAAVAYLLGWLCMLIYGMGGAMLSMVSLVCVVGAGISALSHEWRTAMTAALIAWLVSPYGLPMIAMAAGSALLSIATGLYVWAVK